MSERDNESFDLDDEFLSGPSEDGTDDSAFGCGRAGAGA